jgi:hypothetical protein
MRNRTCALLIAAQLAACTSLRPVEGPRPGVGFAVAPGDSVNLVMHDGKRVAFDVTRSGPAEICGAGGCVPLADVAAVERVETDTPKTLWLVAGVLLLLALAFAASSSVVVIPAPVFP